MTLLPGLTSLLQKGTVLDLKNIQVMSRADARKANAKQKADTVTTQLAPGGLSRKDLSDKHSQLLMSRVSTTETIKTYLALGYTRDDDVVKSVTEDLLKLNEVIRNSQDALNNYEENHRKALEGHMKGRTVNITVNSSL